MTCFFLAKISLITEQIAALFCTVCEDLCNVTIESWRRLSNFSNFKVSQAVSINVNVGKVFKKSYIHT